MSPDNVAYIAIELSVTSWLVAARLPGAEKPRLHRIEGGDTAALLALIAELRSRASAKGGRLAKVVCCFEAGRDGFWLHRLLVAHDITAPHTRADKHSGESSRAAGEDGPTRRRGHAACSCRLAGWRPAGVQHGTRAHTR